MQSTDIYEATIGVEFASKQVQVGKHILKLQIWDTAGQENFRSITRSYYRNAVGAFLVYDITRYDQSSLRRETFDHLRDWLEEVKTNGNPTMQVVLIGNKTDLESQRKVSTEEGRQFAQKEGLDFMEICAMNFKKVQGAFDRLGENIIGKIQSGELSETTVGVKMGDSMLKIDPTVKHKRLYCC